MNATTLKYAVGRLNTTKTALKAKVDRETKLEKVLLTNEQRLKALAAGEFTIIYPATDTPKYWSWEDRVKFKGEQTENYDEAKRNALNDKIDRAYEQALDELYLGDEENALALLQSFARVLD